jgi:fatty-acyl-CoA synthase
MTTIARKDVGAGSRGAEGSSTWLPGGEPGKGRIARPQLRTQADIDEVERVPVDDLLPAGTIYECIKTAAALDPSKPAITTLLSADPGVAPRVITYAQLVALIEKAANMFKRLSGDEMPSVAVILPMLPEALICSWAGATAGRVSPINPYLEIRYIASIMNASRSTILVTTTNKFGPGAWDKLGNIKALVPSLRKVLFVDTADPADDFIKALDAYPSGRLEFTPVTDPNADVVYLPTGGTTAAPKLVRMTQRGQLINAWINGALSGSAADGVVGHAMPNFHVGGLVVIGLRAIIFSQTLLTLTTDGFRNPGVIKNFWDIARKYKMTSLVATPATAAAILAVQDGNSDGHSIRAFCSGGSTVPVELAKAFHARFGVWLREIWGMSESHGTVTGHPVAAEPVVGSVGVHLPYHPIKAIIVDDNNAFIRECAPGERGVLAIGGPGVTAGYVDPRLDADYFVHNMPDRGRWGNTGDLGAIDENGYIWFFGRAKDVIVRGGHNIDPRHVEEVLVGHPAVQIAAAIGKPDAAKGELPVAYVQLKPGSTCDADELMRFCKERVQERAAAPVEITILPQMPMTAVGKISKPALRIDAMRRVATDVATRVLGDKGSCDVSIDDSGLRPRVVLKVRAQSEAKSGVHERLQSAFRDYEFATTIEAGA